MSNSRPAEVFPPGDFIREELEARGWTQVELAGIMGRTVTMINQIIMGHIKITTRTARELAAAFGTSAELWLNLQSAYLVSKDKGSQEDIVRRANLYRIAPVKTLEKRGWIRETKTMGDLESELGRFFGTKEIDRPPQLRIAARSSAEPTSEAISAQTCWGYRVLELASCLQSAEFSKSKAKSGLNQLRQLAKYPDEIRKVPRVLASMGIRFVVVEHLPKSKIDGASLMLEQSYPVIGMSIRHNRIDNFWHTLMHEIDHILHDEPVLDVNLEEGDESAIEDPEIANAEARADNNAADTLIPREQLNSFIARVGPLYSKERINQFANRLGIHPGIVVGQLHHRKEIAYSADWEMLVPVRDIIIQEALTDGWGKTVGVIQRVSGHVHEENQN
jgi:HTH-type transcriptional regulator / antitoxin HigA